MENKTEQGKEMMDSYIKKSVEERGFTSEDIVGIFSPMLLQLERLHANEMVGLYHGIESFEVNEHRRLHLNESRAKPQEVFLEKINEILPNEHSSFDIISEQRMTTDVEKNLRELKDANVLEDIPDQILAPILIPAYKSYESVLGHHDAMTDIQVLGLFMASIGLSIDLREKKGISTLNSILKNPAYASNILHPNILRLIIDMVQLDRRKRIRDATSARIRLENYLEYRYTIQEDFDSVLEQYSEKEGDRDKWILVKLRNRLFDLSKRNRLIYFKKSSRYVNLTLSSVPYVLDYQNIRPEKLVIWNSEIETHLIKGTNIRLNKYLKIKENPSIATSLKKVYHEGNRDKAEFGFNQLKLAFCFLNWYNYKENVNDKIQSPLLLIPTNLKKKKGINDEFTLELLETEAQVNPVLAYYLKELFDIRLPKTFDLSLNSIDEIFETVNSAILRKSNEVQLKIVKKPRLRLIHSLAKRSYESYQKKVRNTIVKNIWGGDGNYSYNASDYRPLGLKLYNEKVRENASYLEFLIDDKIKLNQQAVNEGTKKELYQIESDGSIDPHKWEFDLCNFTLGNFNYQRMTLVNDYDSLIEQKIKNNVFDSLFSGDPKTEFNRTEELLSLKDNYSVIPADPTQLNAIEKAKKGRSYIIQGPPGTGKSQTIANLLANKVADGKTVLFISEKRAALDVVYARMSQIGLKDICTLIHDSQTDKKRFIFDIKDTYEKYSKEDNTLAIKERERAEIISQLESNIGKLRAFHNFQSTSDGSISVRQVIEILLSKGFRKDSIDPRLFEGAPLYREWSNSKLVIQNLEKAIQQNTKFKSLKSCPFLDMGSQVSKSNSTSFIINTCDSLEKELNFLTTRLQQSVTDEVKTTSQLESVIAKMKLLSLLHNMGKLEILIDGSPLYIAYQKELTAVAQAKIDLSKAEEKNQHWKRKPSSEELQRLYKQYQEANSGFFNALLGKKNQFIERLSQFYDFGAHMIPPDPEEIFRNMNSEIEMREKANEIFVQNQISAAIEDIDMAELKIALQYLISVNGNPDLTRDPVFLDELKNIQELSESFRRMIEAKKEVLNNENRIDVLYDRIDDLRISAPALFSIGPRLQEWYHLPESHRSYILTSGLSLDEIEYVSAYGYLVKSEQEMDSSITGSEISRMVEKISHLYPSLLNVNSEYITEKVKKSYQDALDLSYIPSYELTESQKKRKKDYHEGRAVLENEFSKKIRYKSIRDLAAGETGVVIKDLKPIWMMSPLSVSDALPLESMFDIVIFDEASQITVEEGVPPLFRADQAIIVGDEMQMPPSDFFSTKIDESDEEAEFLSMDAESLLNQGSRKLPQVTLGWHYRSRKEALINFSNFAFYSGCLMSIPDVSSPHINPNPIEVFEREDAVEGVSRLLANSISFHYLPNGIYQNRSNEEEANYIAHMVRELLIGENKKSVGIVAFSMQQQGVIESSLSLLAEEDKKFAAALEEAYAGNADEEFTGLFVKNLENVQGDERDIMILSICYGYSPKGRMLMNFGPINRRGGEKRLNVIFSRAKFHMAVIGSIKHTDITNESNEGANYLKKYLQYSELISLGYYKEAMNILSSLQRRPSSSDYMINEPQSALVDQIKISLEKSGYVVETNLGQSRLKINLGVKKKESQEHYDLGILIDPVASYAKNDYLNEYYNKSHILRSFGWKIYKVFANDWLKNKDLVLRAIIQAIDSTEADISSEEIPQLGLTQLAVSSQKIELKHIAKNKFWNIQRLGMKVTIEMGDVGNPPVSNTQHFDTEDLARDYVETQVQSRKGRGFE